jgi:hypothetical protein
LQTWRAREGWRVAEAGSGQKLWRWHGVALALYAPASFLFLDHFTSLTKYILGFSHDPGIFIWFFAWWPWSLAHHLSPLQTNLVWQPQGLNLAWTTDVPFLSALALPLSLMAGPVLAYNVLTLCAPVAAAMAAYFLCLHLTRVPAAALFGGYVFGFSSYEMAETLSHLNLDFTAFVPLLVLVAVLRLEGRLSRMATVLLVGAGVACQFMISTEITATGAVFSVLIWGAALVILPEARARLFRLAGDISLAAPITILLVAPLLWAMFHGRDDLAVPSYLPFKYSNDLTSFLVPTGSSLIGASWFSGFTRHFSNSVEEQGAYIGLPLLLIIGVFFVRRRARPLVRLLALGFALVVVASLGPTLLIGGHVSGLALPWSAIMKLPFLSAAEPDRFALFMWLIIAIVGSFWLAEPRSADGVRRSRLLAVLACAVILPVWHPVEPVPNQKLFESKNLQATIGLHRRVLILPFWWYGNSTYWQEESHFGFIQTGGYLGYPPRDNAAIPVVTQLLTRRYRPTLAADLEQYCLSTGTQFVIAAAKLDPPVEAALAQTGWKRRLFGDLYIYAVTRKRASNLQG